MNHWPPLAAKKDHVSNSFNSNDKPPKSHTAEEQSVASVLKIAKNRQQQSGLVSSLNSNADHKMTQKSDDKKTPDNDSKRRSMATEKRNSALPSINKNKRSYDKVIQPNPPRTLVLHNSPRSPASSQFTPVVVKKRNISGPSQREKNVLNENVLKPPVFKKPLGHNNVQPKKPFVDLKTLGTNMFDLLVEPDKEDDNGENTNEQDDPSIDDVSTPSKRSKSQKEKRRFKKQKTALEKQIKLTKLAQKEAKRAEKAKEKAKNSNGKNALAIQSNSTEQPANQTVSGGILGNLAQETKFFYQLTDVLGTPPPSQPGAPPSPSVSRSEVNIKARRKKQPMKLSTFLSAVNHAALKRNPHVSAKSNLHNNYNHVCVYKACQQPLGIIWRTKTL